MKSDDFARGLIKYGPTLAPLLDEVFRDESAEREPTLAEISEVLRHICCTLAVLYAVHHDFMHDAASSSEDRALREFLADVRKDHEAAQKREAKKAAKAQREAPG